MFLKKVKFLILALTLPSSFVFAQENLPKSVSLKLGLNWKAEPQFGGFYEAQQQGHFSKENLQVEIIEGGSGTPTVQMLVHNQIDYGIISAEELIVANEKNPKSPLVAIYTVYKTNPQMIMTHAERNFKNLKDVFQSEGRLALQQGLSYVQFLTKLYAPIKVAFVPYLGGVGNFQADKKYSQQGFINSEDLLAEKAGLKIKTFLVAESGFNPYTTVLATQQSRLKTSPQEVQNMKKAVQSGWKAYLNSPASTNKHLASLNKVMDQSVLQKSSDRQKKLIDLPGETLGEMKLERWKTLQDQLFELGLIKNKLPAESYLLQK